MGYTFYMPWKETRTMNERVILISEYLSGDYPLSVLARRRGISRKTAYKWIDRYQQDKAGGLEDLSRRPHHHPNALTQEMIQGILEWKAKYPLWGAPKIHSKLRSLKDCPAESTVSNVLLRYGLTRKARARAKATPSMKPLADINAANQIWCADFKGWFRTGNGRRSNPLTISDAYSRYLLCCRNVCGTSGWITVKPLFERTFREYGMPQAIRTDNGAPFASVGLMGLSALSVWWLRLGIELQRIEPGHPEQNGRHERMHRTLKEATAKPPRWTLAGQQQAFDQFKEEYNHERPHEALGQRPPASCYEPSGRDFPERLPEPEYPEGWIQRMVRLNGVIFLQGREVYLSQALSGQRVGLEPIDEGCWKLHFMHQPLALYDERQKHVKPLTKKV
jgi:transposase InsO family protein